ncbi:STAS domain-containing protein [bacterium]|nr:STAS domain-containing protein [bacterium]
MKFTAWASYIRGKTAYVNGGAPLDLDWEGGLEETLNAMINSGVRRIVLTLGPMRFLHYTLFSGLLAVQSKLEKLGGDMVLADVPWFVEMTLRQTGVLHRFALVPKAETVSRAESLTIDLEKIQLPG